MEVADRRAGSGAARKAHLCIPAAPLYALSVKPHARAVEPAQRERLSPSFRPGPVPLPLAAERVLALQRTVGNRAATALVQRQVTLAAPPTRPTVKTGDVDQMVGVLQQKLNVLGESLVIDAEFGSRTRAAVVRFQRTHPPLTANGVADTDTWAALDALVSGGELELDGSLTPVLGHSPADPTGRPLPDANRKPVLRVGSKGVAVAELHEKLNQSGAGLPTATSLDDADAIEFTGATESAVRDFQRRHPPLAVDGVVGKRTWAALDAGAPASTVGRVDEFLMMPARGMDDFGTQAAYDWAVEPNRTNPTRLRIRVRYDFQEDPAAPLPDYADTVTKLLDGIKTVWNVFKAVEVPVAGGPTRPDVDIEFDPQQGVPADKTVVLSAGEGPSNAKHYFITPDRDLVGLSAHEFGHHFGLQDEYQQKAADHLRQTGQAADVGDWQGDGTPPEQIARELGTALRTPPRATHGDRALAVIQGHDLTQGAFAQRVAHRYLRLFGMSVVADCNRLIDADPSEGALNKQRLCTQPFLYTAQNLMGGAETQGTDHEHEVAPRHVRHLCALLGLAVGGIWEPARR
jgi:peptidoglycan hydrolase-like protein with peptidoglycan-binding domain